MKYVLDTNNLVHATIGYEPPRLYITALIITSYTTNIKIHER